MIFVCILLTISTVAMAASSLFTWVDFYDELRTGTNAIPALYRSLTSLTLFCFSIAALILSLKFV